MAEIINKNYSNVYTDETMEEYNTNNSNVANTDAEEDTPKHPYHLQLAEFQPNAWQLEERQPQMYLPLAETKLTMVDSQELLDEMMTKLKQVKEVAIDLEHHTYHSFIGFVCVVKISTRTEDFILDAITLKEEMTVLNEVCTDPNILKVLHGGEKDILWLQRDFGIYIVNMFDTLEPARTFNQKLALPHVLKEICDIDIDKKYQIDWRVRPLPPDLRFHAREDTHYLLYLCDVYTNKCLHSKDTADLLKNVYERSTKLCELVYVLPEYNADSYKTDYNKTKGTLSLKQLECFRLLHEWRYNTAREQNESTWYTFPTKMMFQISQQLPKKAEDITFCKTLPPLVEQNITHLLTLVKKAIDYAPKVTMDSELADTTKKAKKSFCFLCRKSGHMTKHCGKNHYGNPHYGNPHIGAFVGGFGNPSGDYHSSAYDGGYGSGTIPPPYSGYEGAYPGNDNFPGYQSISQPYSQTYGPIQSSYKYYPNSQHPS